MRERRKGFTLIELLVVVAVLAMAAALAGPRVLALRPMVDLRQSAQQLGDVVRMAQARAAELGRAVHVRYDLREETVGVPEVEWTEELPRGLRIGAVGVEGRPLTRGGVVDVPVLSGGYVVPHDVVLEDDAGGSVCVRVAELKVGMVK